LLAEKVLAPRSELKPRIEPAPAAEGPPAAPPTAEGDEQGEESGQPRANTAAEPMPDLERRIDEAPITAVSAKIEFAGLERALAGNAPEAALQIEGTRLLPDGVFVGVRSAVVLLGKGNWDEAAMRRQIAATLAPLFPATGGATLHPVEIAVRGRLLIVTNDAGLLPSIVYAAGYRHSRELPLFARMTRMIDAPQRQGRAPNEERQPLFFSENLASLGGAMRRLESATITVRDTGTTLPQTVVYRLAPAPAAATR
jgi:hypothetical protein